MSKSKATNSGEQSGSSSYNPMTFSSSPLSKGNLHLPKSLPGNRLQDRRVEQHEPKSHNVPYWLRPFFSLRGQLTSVYCFVLMLMIAINTLMIEHQTSLRSILFAVVIVILLGTALSWVVTTVLLCPLWSVTDAAQAIAIGDLEQRERLPLRLPPQDEVDRLAGSLDEMASKLEYAQEIQQGSEERVRRLFSNASHQLRTPLTSIRGFTELLMRGAKDDAEMSMHILARMKYENERMTNLIDDLLTIARLDDQHPLKLDYIDLTKLVIESIEQARTHVGDDCQISLDMRVTTPLWIHGDKARIQQLLFILFDNALKYGQSDSAENAMKITLELDKQDEHVIMLMRNNGKGIAPEDLEHIFEAFYRGRYHSSTTPLAVGAGLGLTIAAAIVHAHKGAITACSSPEHGTEFKVILPYVG